VAGEWWRIGGRKGWRGPERRRFHGLLHKASQANSRRLEKGDSIAQLRCCSICTLCVCSPIKKCGKRPNGCGAQQRMSHGELFKIHHKLIARSILQECHVDRAIHACTADFCDSLRQAHTHVTWSVNCVQSNLNFGNSVNHMRNCNLSLHPLVKFILLVCSDCLVFCSQYDGRDATRWARALFIFFHFLISSCSLRPNWLAIACNSSIPLWISTKLWTKSFVDSDAGGVLAPPTFLQFQRCGLSASQILPAYSTNSWIWLHHLFPCFSLISVAQSQLDGRFVHS